MNSTRLTTLRCLPVLLLASLAAGPALAGEVFSKPPLAGGGVNASSWFPEDGSDWDTYSWDEFTLAQTQVITEVRWRGGYSAGAPAGHSIDFRVSFFNSNASGFEPLITALPEHESQETVIATFHTDDDAGETYAGVSGGVVMYDYHYTLPTPVVIPGGVKCWFRVVGAQNGYPDWGMATGTGGNGSHFYFNTGTSMFQNWPHDLAFSLHSDWPNLGHALAGTHGTPQLRGTGTLLNGHAISLDLIGALENAPTYFVVGLSTVDLPFYGGTLVPAFEAPFGLFLILGTDGAGQLALGDTWPGGVPAGTELYFQHWIVDAAAPYGLAASNAVMGVVP